MGAQVPLQIAHTPTREYLARQGIEPCYIGKVRHTYPIPGNPNLLLVEATDRISIFDFVLPVFVPRKGEVLTAMTHFWLNHVLQQFPHHLVPSQKSPTLNAAHDLKRNLPQLPLERCLVIRKMKIPPYEMIFRHHLGGSVYAEYQRTGLVAGARITPNLPKWSNLEGPIFTPSTKEEERHDRNITTEEYFKAMGEQGRQAVEMFSKAYRCAYSYAKLKGVLILDTKFEGLRAICDEVLTPDSSRLTTVQDFETAMKDGRDPVFYDKELVRKWGRTVETPFFNAETGEKITGINNLTPLNPDHVAFVHSLEVPSTVVTTTTERYLEIFLLLTGYDLDSYQEYFMYVRQK